MSKDNEQNIGCFNQITPADIAAIKTQLTTLQSLQAAIQASLAELVSLMKSTVPLEHRSFSVAATTEVKEIQLEAPWSSMTIINDGGGNCRFRFNDLQGDITSEAPLVATENYSYNPGYPVIAKVFFVSESTSDIRVFGTVGKR